MHPLLERCLLVRDRDLRRWGKPVAVMLGLVGALFLFGSFAVHRMAGELETSLKHNYSLDAQLAETLPESRARAAIGKSLDQNLGTSLKMITAMEIFGRWVVGGAGLLALASAPYAWRSAELASKLAALPDS